MIKLITRADDCGSNHAANKAIYQAARAGFIKNVSFMAPGPEIEEAADMFRGEKEVCLGMHFTINSEWDQIKWIPVSPKAEIASLLDVDGEFYAAPALYGGQVPALEEIEKEWHAQLDRLSRAGLSISYADSHMFSEMFIPGLADAMSDWIEKKGLVDHRYFYRPVPEWGRLAREEGIFENVLKNISDGQYFYIVHPAADEEEMLLCANADQKGENTRKERAMDLGFVISEHTMELCRRCGVQLIRYDEADKGMGGRDSFQELYEQM